MKDYKKFNREVPEDVDSKNKISRVVEEINLLRSMIKSAVLNDTFIQFIEIFCCEGGSRFLEMMYKNNKYMLRMEKLLSPDGLWYKQCVILSGEYAKNEKNYEYNLFEMTEFKTPVTSQNINPVIVRDEYYAKEDEFRYIINHDTRQYVDKEKSITKIHPLSILLEEG